MSMDHSTWRQMSTNSVSYNQVSCDDGRNPRACVFVALANLLVPSFSRLLLAHAAHHHEHKEHKNVKKHPEYGSSNKAGKAKYSPFDLPPKVK